MRIRLGVFKFEVRYKKGIFNSQADALSQLITDGGIVVDSGENYILCILLEVTTDHFLSVNQLSSTENDEDIEGYFSHFKELLENSSDYLILEPVTLFEVVGEQAN